MLGRWQSVKEITECYGDDSITERTIQWRFTKSFQKHMDDLLYTITCIYFIGDGHYACLHHVRWNKKRSNLKLQSWFRIIPNYKIARVTRSGGRNGETLPEISNLLIKSYLMPALLAVILVANVAAILDFSKCSSFFSMYPANFDHSVLYTGGHMSC